MLKIHAFSAMYSAPPSVTKQALDIHILWVLSSLGISEDHFFMLPRLQRVKKISTNRNVYFLAKKNHLFALSYFLFCSFNHLQVSPPEYQVWHFLVIWTPWPSSYLPRVSASMILKDVSRNSLFPMNVVYKILKNGARGFEDCNIQQSLYCRCLVLAPGPIPLRWHHVFISAFPLPEPSRVKLLLMSPGVTTNVCLWEFYKTHTTDLRAQPSNLSLPGKQRLTLRPTKLKRLGACSEFAVHWLSLLRKDGLQAWVF